MSAITGPWMYSYEEDVTDLGFVAPEYQEMADEAAGEDSQSESKSSEVALMQQALQTVQQQAAVISDLLQLLKG